MSDLFNELAFSDLVFNLCDPVAALAHWKGNFQFLTTSALVYFITRNEKVKGQVNEDNISIFGGERKMYLTVDMVLYLMALLKLAHHRIPCFVLETSFTTLKPHLAVQPGTLSTVSLHAS